MLNIRQSFDKASLAVKRSVAPLTLSAGILSGCATAPMGGNYAQYLNPQFADALNKAGASMGVKFDAVAECGPYLQPGYSAGITNPTLHGAPQNQAGNVARGAVISITQKMGTGGTILGNLYDQGVDMPARQQQQARYNVCTQVQRFNASAWQGQPIHPGTLTGMIRHAASTGMVQGYTGPTTNDAITNRAGNAAVRDAGTWGAGQIYSPASPNGAFGDLLNNIVK
jgi:hypothetical protein